MARRLTAEGLRSAITEIHGPHGQRTMARHLKQVGLLEDAGGMSLNRMLLGQYVVPAAVQKEVARLLADVRERRARQSDLEAMIATVRAAWPRASLVYAQVLLSLSHGPQYLRDLCAEIDDDANSSVVNLAVHRLEEMGLVTVDRGETRNSGYTVMMVAPRRIRRTEKPS